MHMRIFFSLWEQACQAYAEQLLEQGLPVKAATYLLVLRKVSELL